MTIFIGADYDAADRFPGQHNVATISRIETGIDV